MSERIEGPKRLVVAIGGNATHPENIRGTTAEQEQIAARAARTLRPVVESAPEVVITHGNGPVVGKILLRQFYARDHVPPMRLDVCVAHSQGGIGHLLMQGLEDELARAEVERRVACVITRVAVNADDKAFTHPTKPIGPFFTEAEAAELQRTNGWYMVEDSGRGWRYVVPSPQPRRILDLDLIVSLAQQGIAVIAAGGGGIPMVLRADGSYGGVPAVIDKDLTSALLAAEMGADTLLMLTGVARVAVDFRKPTQRDLETVTASEIDVYRREGQFAEGSMGPKVRAALNFIAGGGKRAIIAHLDQGADALAGKTGTHVVPG
jgi:carbamate kinase